MQVNAETFMWPNNIGSIFEEHRKLIKSSREKAEESLRERRIKFADELEALTTQLVDFKDLGNVEEVCVLSSNSHRNHLHVGTIPVAHIDFSWTRLAGAQISQESRGIASQA
jgi:hypothetical protein